MEVGAGTVTECIIAGIIFGAVGLLVASFAFLISYFVYMIAVEREPWYMRAGAGVIVSIFAAVLWIMAYVMFAYASTCGGPIF